MAETITEILLTCGHCGNKTNCKVQKEYIQHLESEDGDHFVTTWRILECPACSRLILHQSYIDSYTPDNIEEVTILYPTPRSRIPKVPPKIAKEYEATLKVQSISANACAVLARRTLEAILVHEKATGKTLNDKLNSLIKSDRIPPLLGDVAHLGRQIGNLGAHFEIGEAEPGDVAVMLDFLDTILEYLYVIPAKVASVKERLSELN